MQALQIINRAAELIGYKDPDESLSGADASNFLGVLNSMVDGWNTQRMFIVAVAEVTASVSGLPITIGPDGDIDVTRPTRMEKGSFVRLNGVDYPITWLSRVDYDSIPVKATAGTPAYYGYYEPAVPVGNIYLWPYPSTAASLHLKLQTQLTEFADLATQYDLAQGYRKALEYSLAEELGAGRRALDPRIAQIAASARRAIRRSNVEIPKLSLNGAGPGGYQSFIAGL